MKHGQTIFNVVSSFLIIALGYLLVLNWDKTYKLQKGMELLVNNQDQFQEGILLMAKKVDNTYERVEYNERLHRTKYIAGTVEQICDIDTRESVVT